jgi:transporter family protein
MAPWTSPALGAAVFFALHYLLLRAASGRLEDRLGALVLEGTAAVVLAVAFFAAARGEVPTTRAGVGFAMASGVAVSGTSVLLFTALRRGGPVASTGTIVLGGGVALSALLAPLLFAESFNPRRVLGVALGVAAMWVLSHES